MPVLEWHDAVEVAYIAVQPQDPAVAADSSNRCATIYERSHSMQLHNAAFAAMTARTLVNAGSILVGVAKGSVLHDPATLRSLQEAGLQAASLVAVQLARVTAHNGMQQAQLRVLSAPCTSATPAAVHCTAKAQAAAAAAAAAAVAAAAAGVAAQVHHLLTQLKASLGDPPAVSGADEDGSCTGQQEAAQLLQLGSEMQQCGAAVCVALPVRFCCNNPYCLSLDGLSEHQAVAGRMSTCSGCKAAR
jgi:hypothetical protein